MRATYDAATDTLELLFRVAAVAGSDELRPGIVVEYDHNGGLVRLTIEGAARRVDDPAMIALQVVSQPTAPQPAPVADWVPPQPSEVPPPNVVPAPRTEREGTRLSVWPPPGIHANGEDRPSTYGPTVQEDADGSTGGTEPAPTVGRHAGEIPFLTPGVEFELGKERVLIEEVDENGIGIRYLDGPSRGKTAYRRILKGAPERTWTAAAPAPPPAVGTSSRGSVWRDPFVWLRPGMECGTRDGRVRVTRLTVQHAVVKFVAGRQSGRSENWPRDESVWKRIRAVYGEGNGELVRSYGRLHEGRADSYDDYDEIIWVPDDGSPDSEDIVEYGYPEHDRYDDESGPDDISDEPNDSW